MASQIFLAFTPSSFVPCFASELFKAPVLSEKPPQIMAVNDEIIDPEFIPEIKIFLFDFMELHLEFGGAVIG